MGAFSTRHEIRSKSGSEGIVEENDRLHSQEKIEQNIQCPTCANQNVQVDVTA